MIYLELLKALEDADIRYVIVGGLAVVLHGFARLSMDLDLAISLDANNTKRFLGLAKKLGYQPKLPVALDDFADSEKRRIWIEQKHMRVFPLFHSKRHQELVDVFVDEPIAFATLYERHEKISVGGFSVKVASIDDLKALKRIAGRPQDLEDIAALEHIQRRKSQ